MKGSVRILVVEDYADTRELLHFILTPAGFEVVTVSTVSEGLRRSEVEHFDLYLLDSRLPDGSGVDLCRKIRAHDPHTPIVFYSGAAFEEDRKAGLAAGAQAYLVKPEGFDHLMQTIRGLVNERKDAVQASEGGVLSGKPDGLGT